MVSTCISHASARSVLYFVLLILFTDDGITIFFNLEQLLNSSPSESVELYNTDCILNSVHPSLILSSVLF